jgi:hypothetical protein
MTHPTDCWETMFVKDLCIWRVRELEQMSLMLFQVIQFFSDAFENCDKGLFDSSCLSVLPSIRPRGTTRLPLDGFSWNLIFECFSKICREYSSFLKIWQEWLLIYVETDIYFWLYLPYFYLEWEIFHTKVVEEIKAHILRSVTFFPDCCLCDNVEK